MNRKSILIGLLLTLVIWGISIYGYTQMPARIPIHWNLQGEIDGYGDRFWGAFLTPMILFGLFLLAIILPKISPKSFTVETFQETYSFGMLLALGCVAYIQLVLLRAMLSKGGPEVGRFLLGGLCLFWILFGNLLGKIRRNYWMGIRTPWTLASERVWNETHRMSAKLFLISGLAGLAILFLGWSPAATTIAIVGLILGDALIAVAYSLIRYRSLEQVGKV